MTYGDELIMEYNGDHRIDACGICGSLVEFPVGVVVALSTTGDPVCPECAGRDAAAVSAADSQVKSDADCPLPSGASATDVMRGLVRAKVLDGMDAADSILAGIEAFLFGRGRLDVLLTSGLWAAATPSETAIGEGILPVEYQGWNPIVCTRQHTTRAAFVAVATRTATGILASAKATGGVAEWERFQSGDPGHITLPDGRRALVRVQDSQDEDLWFFEETVRIFTAPLAIVAVPNTTGPEIRTVNVMGWIGREEFLDRARSTEYVKGRWCSSLSVDELHSMESLQQFTDVAGSEVA